MVRYYKLFDLLNRLGKKKSDLREIISPKTVAKLTKGEYISGEVIEKICIYLKCQPSDIMEIFEEIEVPCADGTKQIARIKHELPTYEDLILLERERRGEEYERIRKEMEANE